MGAEAAISTVVKLLSDLVIHKVNFIRGVKGEVPLLITEFKRMQSFLIDANKKQAQDERVRNWISDIREVALDAEDAIEMFILHLEYSRRNKGLLRFSKVFLPHVPHLERIGNEIVAIRARLEDIDKSRDRYLINDLGESGESAERLKVEARRRLAPWEKDEHLVGVEVDVEKLLKSIMDNEKKGLSVTAVVGMGGIGKSTLAREVFNHPNIVSGRFDCRAWVVVSSEFNLQETIKQLVLEMTKSEPQQQQLLDKIKKLQESTTDNFYIERKLKHLFYEWLVGKTYFVVLDDVWKTKHWDSLVTAFPKDTRSRLLLTTRNKGIANRCQSLHEMKFLDPERSWELFVKKALAGNTTAEFPKELEKKGYAIVDTCNGLPLAISVMGGLLAETQCNGEWEEALDGLDSQLGRSETRISTILELSYQHLPQELKSCFLCLAFFKGDVAIPVKRLLNIMVGQCLVQPTGRTTVEEIARGCLDELIKRSMVHIKVLTLDNRVKSCYLHDSLRSICLKWAKKEMGLELLRRDSDNFGRKPRHRVVQCHDLSSFENIDQNKHIRSLFVLNVEEDSMNVDRSYWKSFQHLKTLDLDGYYRLERVPNSVKSLLGLKQFRIGRQLNKKSRKSYYSDFFTKMYKPLKLPTWLDDLQKLELLDIRTESVEFPEVALDMGSLRHIHASRIFGPLSMANLKKVETLKYIRLEDWMKSSSKLMDSCNVRALGIFVNDNDGSSNMSQA